MASFKIILKIINWQFVKKLIEKMKILLLMNENSYAGREYLSSLKKEDIKIDAISIGTYPKYDIVEENRCGGLWKPEQQEILSKFHNFFTFDSLNSKGLIQLLKKK